MRGWHIWQITEKGGFQQAFSNLVSNFKEASKKLIIVYGGEKL
jgi:hypothetical protein